MQNSSSCLCSHLFCPSCMARNKSKYSKVTKNQWICYVLNLYETKGRWTNKHLEGWYNHLQWQILSKSLWICWGISERTSQYRGFDTATGSKCMSTLLEKESYREISIRNSKVDLAVMQNLFTRLCSRHVATH